MTYGFPSRQRRRIVPLLACVLMGGCAMPYQDVLQRGYKYTSESIRKPPDVADCVAARMQSQREFRVTRRPLDDRGSIEIVVGSGNDGVAAVAHVFASPYGSRIDSWITQRAVLTRDIMHAEFFGAC